MPNNDADTLRNSVRITDLIQRYGLHTTGTGNELSTEEHDSLKLFVSTNSWYWYSKGIGGDVFDWVMQAEKCDFPAAVDYLRNGNFTPAALPARRDPEPARDLRQDLHLLYHRALDEDARQWWHSQGISNEAISRFFLGVCDWHPIYRQATYTIPVIDHGRLLNVRHRLSAPPTKGDKYRPEYAGLGSQLFNADILTPDLGGVVVVAGEKKVIVLWQYGIPAVSTTAGCGTWRDEWTTALQFCKRVYVAFDPGEGENAWKVAGRIGERAYIVALPDKPDDFILAKGDQAFRQYLRSAEPYADRDYWQKQLGEKPMWGRLLEQER